MRNLLRLSGGVCALMLVMLLVPSAAARSDALDKAAKLFKTQQYEAAQVALLAIDTNDLTDTERNERSRLLAEVNDAIPASKQAQQDVSAADLAFDEGRWDDADRLCQQVLDNRYASPELKEAAISRQHEITEKRKAAAKGQPGIQPGKQPAASKSPSAATVSSEQPATTPVEQIPPEDPTRPLTVIEKMQRRDALYWQRATARMNEFAALARTAMDKGDFTEARRLADAALQTIEAARIYAAPASKYELAKATAEDLKAEVQGRADEAGRLEAAREREQIKLNIGITRARQAAQREAKIEQMLQTVETLGAEHRYEEAVEVLRQILVLDPTNSEASHLLGAYKNFVSFAKQNETMDRFRERTRQALEDADEYLIPTDHNITYPENWVELSRKRGNFGRAARGDLHEQRVAMERRLQRPVSEINFEELTLEEIVDILRERYDVDIRIDPILLENYGVDLATLITIDMQNTTLLEVLEEIVDQAGGLDVDLALDMSPGYVEIKPREELTAYGRSYEVQHIIPRDATRLDEGTGGGSSQQEDEDWEEIRDRIEEAVIPQIESYTPGIWEEPATVGITASPPGNVVVTQTYEGHKLVDDAVRNLGTGGAGPDQAAFEARFLTITSNFLEQIGVDLDFVFNSGTAGIDQAFSADGGQIRDAFTQAPVLVDRRSAQAGFYPSVPNLGTAFAQGAVPAQPYGNAAFVPTSGGIGPSYSRMTPVPIQQSSLDLVNPAGLVTGVPGSLNELQLPALSIAGSFLDNLQVDFLIRATQANRRSSVVQAPRLVVANLESGEIRIVRQFQTIGNLQGQVGENTGIAAPGEGTEPEQGVTMRLTNVEITPNRQYVRTRIRIENNGEPIITPFTVQRASGNSPGLTVEKYEQDQNIIQTVASIPDGGTVLLGGIKRVGEAEIEAGVPILSKIPILKRAFTNTTTVKDTQTVFVLLKVSIIIPEEAELEAFPTLGSTSGGY